MKQLNDGVNGVLVSKTFFLRSRSFTIHRFLFLRVVRPVRQQREPENFGARTMVAQAETETTTGWNDKVRYVEVRNLLFSAGSRNIPPRWIGLNRFRW